MTRDTEGLVRQLAANTNPVRPLARPWVRAALWLVVAVPAVMVMAFVVLPRGDLISKLSTPRYLSEEAFALATGVLAAFVAFASVVPGYDRKVLVLPFVPFALWLGVLDLGSARDWLQLEPHGFSFQLEWFCLPAMAMVGALPAIAMAIMLRRGAPLTPRVSVALGGLAAAGLGNLGVCLSHREFSGVRVLVWHVSAVVLLSALAGCVGRYLLNWPSILERSRVK
jgi:hypothetical protein